MNFDFNSGKPIYLQVASQIEEGILQGSFKVGEQVPSTTDISKMYKINPATVLKGMNELVAEGILEKRRGLGMFVSEKGESLLFRKRQAEFSTQLLAEMMAEAKRLGMTKEQLISLIEGGYDDESVKS